MSAPARRSRGRPVGGGNSAEQAREVLMDAAEHLFTTRGHRASTMEVIAHEAGYSRTAIYRQFANRNELIAAMVQRTTQRHMASILTRMPEGARPIDLLVESMVIVATELVADPLLNTIADQTPDGTIASLIAKDTDLTDLVTATVEGIIADDATPVPARPTPERSGAVHHCDRAELPGEGRTGPQRPCGGAGLHRDVHPAGHREEAAAAASGVPTLIAHSK